VAAGPLENGRGAAGYEIENRLVGKRRVTASGTMDVMGTPTSHADYLTGPIGTKFDGPPISEGTYGGGGRGTEKGLRAGTGPGRPGGGKLTTDMEGADWLKKPRRILRRFAVALGYEVYGKGQRARGRSECRDRRGLGTVHRQAKAKDPTKAASIADTSPRTSRPDPRPTRTWRRCPTPKRRPGHSAPSSRTRGRSTVDEV